MVMSRIYSLMPLLALLSLFSSCEHAEIISESKVFDSQIWRRFDILKFDFTIENPDVTYDVMLLVEHTDNYYSDHLTTNITFYMPGGSMRSRDYTFKLQNDKLEWLGKIENNTVSHVFPVITEMKFPEAGDYKVRIESKMTKYNLEDMKSVGLSIKPTK